MTEKKSQRGELKTEISKIANRFLEIYFGEERPVELSVGWRIFCALAGAVTFLSLALAASTQSQKLIFINFREVQSFSAAVQNIFGIVMVASPFLLALMIAYSIKKGGPLRFFLVGYFLYSLMLLAAA